VGEETCHSHCCVSPPAPTHPHVDPHCTFPPLPPQTRARDLFYALWIPDLFMRRVESGGNWSLFCPSEAPGLVDLHGDEFTQAYEAYEREGRATKVMPAQTLWFAILESQVCTRQGEGLWGGAGGLMGHTRGRGERQMLRGSRCWSRRCGRGGGKERGARTAGITLPLPTRRPPTNPRTAIARGRIHPPP
jgi:hypothetical protein